MRRSQAFLPTLKEVPAEATQPSHVWLLRGGYIRQVGAGIYQLLPLGLRVLRRIEAIVRREMDAAGGQELLLPALLPAEYFKETGRYAPDTGVGEILFRFRDRKGGEYHLGPTHEEIITDLARRELKSYKQLPALFYQMQTKFRDEARPRAGLLRCREFLMKDAYSFSADADDATAHYERMRAAYQRIFAELGLAFRVVDADSGGMGGSQSAEFQILAAQGEDDIYACEQCDHAANVEVMGMQARPQPSQVPASSPPPAEAATPTRPCPKCGGTMRLHRAIEGGHIFVLGTHYSEKMKAHFLDKDGKAKPLVMGCYGIGVSRLMAAIVEQHHDAKGILWPESVAPFHVALIPLGKDEEVRLAADNLDRTLHEAGFAVLYDDRGERPGIKFADAEIQGMPWQLRVGARGLANGEVELYERKTGETTLVHMSSVVPTLHARRSTCA